MISRNLMIDGFCKPGQLRNVELFVRMGAARNAVSSNTMIMEYIHSHQFGRAIDLFEKYAS